MANEDVLNTKELRLRITKLEYDVDHDIPKNKHKINEIEDHLKKDIRKIYKDETGKNLKADITVTLSEEKGIGAKSGYGGTAIRFKNKAKDINQVYLFLREPRMGKIGVMIYVFPPQTAGLGSTRTRVNFIMR